MTQCLFTRENPSGITHEKELEDSTWRDADVQCESKKSSPPKTFFRYFHLWWTGATKNFRGYCPNIFLCLHQFWPIYL